mmetsp:Transcript_53916/g.101058  ORF Transcript_53916/g.101058 Transcript_53916/m.101058 type:complete len:341 (-) Transcript_53916:226-1248(-)
MACSVIILAAVFVHVAASRDTCSLLQARAKTTNDLATFKWDLCPQGYVLQSGTEHSGDLCRDTMNSSSESKCPQFCDATEKASRCVMIHASDLCRSKAAFDFWNSSSISSYENKGVIHTLFDHVTGMSESERHTLLAWEKIWQQAGFKTRVLTRADAERSPFYPAFKDAFSKVNLGNNPEYRQNDFLRYLAMAEVGGGWMADFDVIPTFITPDMPLFNQGNFTVYQDFVPALISGTRPEWERMVQEILKRLQNPIYRPIQGGLYSDMFALQDVQQAYKSETLVASPNTWGPEMGCQTMRVASLAAHFSHASLGAWNASTKDRPGLMEKGRAKFLDCQSSI